MWGEAKRKARLHSSWMAGRFPAAASLAVALLLTVGCGESPTPVTGCESAATLSVDCRFRNPEDLEVYPESGQLLVSQMGEMDGSRPGNLVRYIPGGEIRPLFPVDGFEDDRSWGEEACPPPDMQAFSPHGIHLRQRADGRWMLLVVNHGGRESVEFFQVVGGPAEPGLIWRGCAMGPEKAAFNDVAGARDGGFYVTHMFPADDGWMAMLKGALFGSDTGFVYHWSREGGWEKVVGSEGAFPNGIEIARDGSALYINMYLAGEVRKLDLSTEQVVTVAMGGNPDNSTWASDGRLLVATHTDGVLESMACQGLEEGSCGFAFRIVALDPVTLAAETIVENRGPPMGGATVAREMDGMLYLGTFAGDRIAAFPWSPEPQ